MNLDRSIERFCTHHDIESFDSGRAEVDEDLRRARRRFEAGFPDIAFVVVDGARRVYGYIIGSEIVFKVIDRGRRFLLLSRVGTDKEEGSNTITQLIMRAYHVYDLLQKDSATGDSERYYGAMVDSHDDTELEELLHRHGYRQVPGTSYWRVRDPRHPKE